MRGSIATDEGHAFPLGTVETVRSYVAQADFNDTANTLGRAPYALYATQDPLKFDRGTDLHTQSNPPHMCHRPAVLVEPFTSN